jgi:hypothetical protein
VSARGKGTAAHAPIVADAWKLHLTRTKRGYPASVGNLIAILAHDPQWAGALALDEFSNVIVTRRVPPWFEPEQHVNAKPGAWTDADTTRTRAWLARE